MFVGASSLCSQPIVGQGGVNCVNCLPPVAESNLPPAKVSDSPNFFSKLFLSFFLGFRRPNLHWTKRMANIRLATAPKNLSRTGEPVHHLVDGRPNQNPSKWVKQFLFPSVLLSSFLGLWSAKSATAICSQQKKILKNI